MNFFTLRLSRNTNDLLTHILKDNIVDVEIIKLNQLKTDITADSCFFICIGGGKSSTDWWADSKYKGLLFIAKLTKMPEYYDESNYKISIHILYKFSKPITKNDCKYYPDTYDTEVGPQTRGRQTQAISYLTDINQVAAILHVCLFYDENAKCFYESYFDKSLLQLIYNPINRLVEQKLTFEQEKSLENGNQFNTITEDIKSSFLPSQIIYYGVPGSGKSFKIDNEITKGAKDVQKQKVVFHPDYTNSDFIGQIIPKMKEIEEDGKRKSIIEYSFKPGPFATILRRALRDKNNQYYLLIEEINRGNAAAIFGDLFQLLDRDESGWSCSPVNNDDINFYVASEYEYWDENYSDSHPYDSANVNHPSGKQFSRNSGLQLPPNLSIYATMNTNDQNVFTLDNAFNRRFKPEYISNKEDNKIPAHRTQYNLIIENTEIRWGAFRNVINKYIIANGLANAEDKQLGLFFIKAEKGQKVITQKNFADKVLKYLWHDVFKRDKDVFNTANISKFEDLIDKFTGKNAFTDCFAADFVTEINKGDINKDLTESKSE